MANFTTEHLRNIVLIGHGGSGKTTLAEALLFDTGVLSRRGRVEDGTTAADWDEEAIRRKQSVAASVVSCEFKGNKLNILDTPGFLDFAGEAKGAVSVADVGLVLVDPVSGVEVGTELGWGYLDERQLPRAVFVNKMDRENAQFERVMTNLRDMFSGTIVSAFLPIGEGSEFKGVVDVIGLKAYMGEAATVAEIPAGMDSAVQAARTQLVEAAAEGDDELIMKYLDGEELSAEEIARGLRAGIANGAIVPVFCGSAANNLGVRPLMDALIAYLPSPLQRPSVSAKRPNGDELELSALSTGPLAMYVWKTVADPYVGKVSYFRVVSGTLHGDLRLYSMPGSNDERVSQIFAPRGKEQLAVTELAAGDIGGVTKLASTGTNDTLSEKANSFELPQPVYPEPLYSVAISPKTKADSAKMGPALNRVTEEDPSLSWRQEQGTNETILSGMGEQHIELAVRRMETKFGVGLLTTVPKVPYRESITKSASDYHRH